MSAIERQRSTWLFGAESSTSRNLLIRRTSVPRSGYCARAISRIQASFHSIEGLHMDRREFLAGSLGATILASWSADAFAQRGEPPKSATWDSGQLRHILPTVSDTRM